MINRNEKRTELEHIMGTFKKLFNFKKRESVNEKVERVSRQVQECNQFISVFERKREELISALEEKFNEFTNVNNRVKEARNKFNRCCSHLVNQNNEKSRNAVYNAALERKYYEDEFGSNIISELKRLEFQIGFNILDTYNEIKRKNRYLNKEMECDFETYKKFCLGIKVRQIFEQIDKMN